MLCGFEPIRMTFGIAFGALSPERIDFLSIAMLFTEKTFAEVRWSHRKIYGTIFGSVVLLSQL
jgi:hypothetical protein